MPISVDCPECGARCRFSDQMAGKRGRCKGCGERIEIRASRKRSSKGKRRKKQEAPTGLIIGGVIVVSLLLIGGGIFFFLNSGSDDPALNQIAENGAAGDAAEATSSTGQETVDPASDQIAMAPGRSEQSSESGGTSNQPTNSTTQKTSGSNQNTASKPSSSSGGFQKAGASGDEETLKFLRSAEWKVEPDPLQSSAEFEAGRPLKVKLDKNSLRGSGLVFPYGPSPFFAALAGSSSKRTYEIYDVTEGRKIGETPAGTSSSLAALAPDGSYLALSTSVAEKVEVFDIAAKKSLGVLALSEGSRFQISSLAIWNDKLVALSTIQKGFKVWELPSGKLVQHVTADDKFNPSYGHCFSPGGRYLAVDGQFLDKRIDIFDLMSGQVVGSITPDGKPRVNELEALGISSDGARLAAIYGIDVYGPEARKYSRMLIWDISTGKVLSDFEIEPRLKEQLDPVYESHTLQSLPGGNYWLAHSLGVINADVEQLVFSFQKQDDISFVPARKVMGPNWMMAAMTEGGDPRVEINSVTEETLLAGAATATAGGFASDAGLPPLTPTDFEKASDAIAADQWTATVDPVQVGAVKNSVTVTSVGLVRDIAISRNQNPVVVVRTGIDEDLNDPELTNFERTRAIYESRGLTIKKPQPVGKESELIAFAADGKQVAKLKVPFSCQLHAVSPDGKFAVVEQHRTNGRLDIYSLQDDGQHLIGWRPFRSEGDKKDRELQTVDFLDSQHLATLGANNKLVVWELPGLRPVWKLDEVLNFAASPGGNQIAVIRGGILGAKGISLFSSKSGEGLGTVPLEGTRTAIAFHSGGEHLAVSTDSEANKLMRVIDMTTGNTFEEFPIPVSVQQLAWTGADYLLINGSQLVNRPLQAVVWSYRSENILFPPRAAGEQVVLAQTPGNRALIRAVEIPSDSISSKLDATRLANQAVLKPGDSVTLDLQIAGGAELQAVKGIAASAIEKQLQAAGTKVSGGSAVTVVVSATYKSDGNVTLSKIGDRSVSETVERKSILFDFSYKTNGKTIWKSVRRVSNLDRLLVRLKQGQSAQAAIDEQMAENVERTLTTMKFPTYLFGENASQGLGSSTFFE